MYTLFGYQRSGSAAIEMALDLCGAEYTCVEAASWAPDSAIDELAAANPLRQVPTLRLPDGGILTESAAMLIHLGLAFPASRLWAANDAARDQSIRGLVFIAANCYAAIGVIDYPERWCVQGSNDVDEPTHDRIRRGATLRLHAGWDAFADQFPATPWLAGDDCGALDLLAAVVSKWSGARAHLAGSRPDFAAALGRIDAHPPVARVLARHGFPQVGVATADMESSAGPAGHEDDDP